MPSINTSITIQAPPSVVRQIFFDFPSYPEWNPFIASLESPVPSPPPGTRIKFVIDNRLIEPKVVENTPERFSWVGILFGSWFFQGHHFFEFEPFGEVGEGGETVGCKLLQHEKFTGAFAWLLLLVVGGKTEKGFNDMNKALKERAEAAAVK
jgi:hypothetical protein